MVRRVLIAFRLQSEFGLTKIIDITKVYGVGLNRLSADVLIWAETACKDTLNAIHRLS